MTGATGAARPQEAGDPAGSTSGWPDPPAARPASLNFPAIPPMIEDKVAIDGGGPMQDGVAPASGHDAGPTAGPRRGLPPMWRRLDASLVYDSRQRPVLGVRAVAAGLPRLMYRAPGYEVDLQVRPGATAGRYRLLGQVLDGAFEPCEGWAVVENGHSVVEMDLDECGHFAIDGLLAGWHRIEVHLPLALVVLPPVCL